MTQIENRRAVIGPLMIALGVIHLALTPVLYPQSVRSLVDGGVIASVEADPTQTEIRGLGFWFATFGVLMVAYGFAVTDRERQTPPLPASLPAALAAVGVWGVLLMPTSPFWVLLLLAGLAAARRSATRRRAARAAPSAGSSGGPITVGLPGVRDEADSGGSEGVPPNRSHRPSPHRHSIDTPGKKS